MDINEVLQRDEYKFLKTDQRLIHKIILIGYGGSYAYGTNTETSDIDLRAVAVRTKKDILISKDFETITNNETDTTVYSFDRILGLLAECNPNCIEILGLKPEHYADTIAYDYSYSALANIAEKLLKMKSVFLSKHCINTFGGYATQQLYRLRQKSLEALTPEEYNNHIAKVIEGMYNHLENNWHIPRDKIVVKNTNEGLKVDVGAMNDISLEDFYGMNNEITNVIRTYYKNSARNEKAMAHNKINKHAMHLLRLFMMAIDLLKDGEIITYREKEHDLLMDIRNGKYMNSDGMMNKDFWDIYEEYEAKFGEAKNNTKLPDHPDYKKIEEFRYETNDFITKLCII